MEKLLLDTGNSAAIVTMLLLFIAGLLTKRFVPWWVYEDVLKKLNEYQDAAPSLISEIRRLMILLDKQQEAKEQGMNIQEEIQRHAETLKKVSDSSKVDSHGHN